MNPKFEEIIRQVVDKDAYPEEFYSPYTPLFMTKTDGGFRLLWRLDEETLDDVFKLLIEEIIKVNYESGISTVQKVALENMYKDRFGI